MATIEAAVRTYVFAGNIVGKDDDDQDASLSQIAAHLESRLIYLDGIHAIALQADKIHVFFVSAAFVQIGDLDPVISTCIRQEARPNRALSRLAEFEQPVKVVRNTMWPLTQKMRERHRAEAINVGQKYVESAQSLPLGEQVRLLLRAMACSFEAMRMMQ